MILRSPNRSSLALVALFLSLSGLAGCAADKVTTVADEPVKVKTTAVSSAARVTTDEDGVESETDGDDEPELKPEDFEMGFCVDDVYARYLTGQYAAIHKGEKTPAPAPTYRRTRRGKRVRVQGTKNNPVVASLSYARDHMNGKTAPFFGAIPIVVNDRVDFWVQYFKSSGRRQFMSWLVRGESVKRMVQPILQEAGVPIEFFYLAMIESGFSNSAYSHARATGTWQFMSGTAQLYGLKINHWVDERRDPIKSTLAAANYLKDLYAELGDWHLAMAAYNAGPGTLRKAIRLGNTRDYWTIAESRNLAKETKQYVPKVLAAILLATEYRRHGFDFQPNPVDLLPETEIIVKRPVMLEELATKLGLSRRTLVSWNPELIRDITPPGKTGYALRLPQAYANLFPSIENSLSYIEVTDIHMHTVKRGDTLSRIAQQYKVGIKQILSVNPGVKAARLRPGNTIAIPIPGVVSTSTQPKHARL